MNVWIVFGVVFWLAAWIINIAVSRRPETALFKFLMPCLFGVTILVLWECAVRGFGINPVLLPAPSAIAVMISQSTSILWVDFVQTVLKGAVSGYIIGCGSAILAALCVDRIAFLKHGLLPIGNFVAALPIIGMAPILVMWFGFDWQSKAAVVVVMVFFPVLVNTLEGLEATDKIGRDLMRTYASTPSHSLKKLRIPAAMPFIFNGLKISTTLALIGAIVAEFFGSPVKGMGFRISTSVGQLNLAMVWAEIFVAAIAGTAFYGGLSRIEKWVTFWHPSQRG